MELCALAIDGNMLHIVAAHDRPPQNIPQWHIDYIEFKLLNQQPVPQGHLDPPLAPRIQEINLPYEKCPPCTWKTPLIVKHLQTKKCVSRS